MRQIVKPTLVGAAIGCVLVTIFATGEMLGQPDQPPVPVVLILALAMGGLLVGAPIGAGVGAVVGWVRRRRETQHEEVTEHAPAYATAAAASSDPGPSPTTGSTPAPRAPAAPLQHDPAARSAARERVATASQQQAQRQGHIAPADLAPVAPAPHRSPREDVDLADPERLNRVLEEIDAMPGMDDAAAQVRTMARRIMLDQRRRAEGLAVSDQGLHLLLIGPRGVGKTTLARIWGRVLVACGLLPSGHVVETDRGGLVGATVGSTAPKTTEQIDKAMGGVLFVDEAYALSPDTGGQASNDFGAEAISTLLKAMEDRRGEFVVIMAGYPADMERLLDSNEGLRSRFPRTLTLDHYSGDVVTEIALSMAKSQDYALTDEAVALLRTVLTRMAGAKGKDWANGRTARDLLDAVISAQSDRLGQDESIEPHREVLMTLTEEDVREAVRQRFSWVLEG